MYSYSPRWLATEGAAAAAACLWPHVATRLGQRCRCPLPSTEWSVARGTSLAPAIARCPAVSGGGGR